MQLRNKMLRGIIILFSVIGGLSTPLRHEDGLSLGQSSQVSELGDHVARSRIIPGLVKSITQDDQDRAQTQRFQLPGPIPIDTEQIKKVAQILLVLGEQVIPAILGEGSVGHGANMLPMKPAEIPNDDGVDD